jgi:hypothetical protein
MKKLIIVLLLLDMVALFPAMGQETYWDNGYYKIINQIPNYPSPRDFYSLVLYEDDLTKIRIVYYGPRLFIVIDEKTSEYTEDEEYKYIFHYNDFFNNWGKYENNSVGKFILYFNPRSEYYINDRDGYAYLLEGLLDIDGFLPGVSYYVAYISSIIQYKENIPGIESLEIIFPNGIEKRVFSTEYQKQAIQEIIKIGFREGLI